MNSYLIDGCVDVRKKESSQETLVDHVKKAKNLKVEKAADKKSQKEHKGKEEEENLGQQEEEMEIDTDIEEPSIVASFDFKPRACKRLQFASLSCYLCNCFFDVSWKLCFFDVPKLIQLFLPFDVLGPNVEACVC